MSNLRNTFINLRSIIRITTGTDQLCERLNDKLFRGLYPGMEANLENETTKRNPDAICLQSNICSGLECNKCI